MLSLTEISDTELSMEQIRLKARRLEFQKTQALARVDSETATLTKLRRQVQFSSLGQPLYQLILLEVNNKDQTAQWQANFVDSDEGQRAAYIAVHKSDWCNFKLGIDLAKGL